MTKQEYVNIIKSTFVNCGTKALMSYLKVQIPFFSLPVVSYLTEKVISYLLDVLANKTETGAFFIYIDFRVSAQGREFSNAALNNFEVQKNGTPEEKANAEKILIDSFRNLIKFTN